MARRTLIWLFLAVSALGIGVIAIPFVVSFNPSEKVFAERPRVRIPNLLPGQFAFVQDPTWDYGEFMFIRRPDGKLDVWHVATRDRIHALPDYYWWRRGIPCKNFGPNFDKGIIQCSDTDFPEWAKTHYIWMLDGKSLDRYMADLEPVIGFEEAGDYVLGKKQG